MGAANSPLVIERHALDTLIAGLRARGYTVIGPTVSSQAIVHAELTSADQLPAGWTDEQEAGRYRLVSGSDEAVFAHNVGPNSWKETLFPPRLPLWKGRRSDDGDVEFELPERPPRFAFIGVRSCDLHAIAIQDRVFIRDQYVERDYEARRRDAFIVAVNCSQAAATCFCVSMGTGPKAQSGFDLALTELLDDRGHRFLVEVGSDRGAELLDELPHRAAGEDDQRLAGDVVARTANSMERTLNTDGIKELLYENAEHPRWDEVAERCLTCGNCTMVCPTCFCSTVEDSTDIGGDETERSRQWDSCFTLGHSYIHGGSVHRSGRSRYRQWMTHKLASWIDQFGSSGCVGCGRCITWCPVAIDITEEVAAIRADDLRELATGTHDEND
jgi:ferredoxin